MQDSTYGAIYAGIYDIGSDRPKLTDFYLSHCRKAAQPILEPMCGTGHFITRCMSEGLDIDGTDLSPDMLQVCREKCDETGLQPTLYEQRIEELDLPRQYGHIMIPDGSFSHIYDKHTASSVLRRLHGHLLPEGTMILDVSPIPEEQAPTGTWNANVHDLPGGIRILSYATFIYKEDGRILHVVHKHERYENGQLVDTNLNDYIQRYYDRDEFTRMLSDVGFQEITVTKGWEDHAEPGPGDNMVFMCRR